MILDQTSIMAVIVNETSVLCTSVIVN